MQVELHDTVAMDGVNVTRDGYLAASAKVARSGIQLYDGTPFGRPGKTIRVYRPEKEVFNRDAMRSYAHRPVTLNHPPVPVGSDNWKDFAVGQVGEEVARDGDFVRVPMVLMDQLAIDAVNSGVRQLSMGYTCDLEFKDGVTEDGEKYDAVQKNMRMNHLAVVAAARGGSDLKIGDSRKEPTMDKTIDTRTILVDGLQVVTTDAGATAIEKLQSDLAAERAKLTDTTAEHATTIEAKDAEIGTLKAEVQQLKDSATTPEQLDQMVASRAELVAKATALDAKVETAGKSDAEIRKAIVVAKLGDDFKDAPDAQIEGAFAVLAKDAKVDPVRAAVSTTKPVTTPTTDASDAYAASVEAMQNAWKGDQKEAS